MTATWFSAPAPVTRRVRAYFAPVNRATQTPVLFDPSQQGGFSLAAPPAPWIDLGWIQDFARKPASKSTAAADGHSCRDSRASARVRAGAGEPAVLELDQADDGAGDGIATYECAGRGERRKPGGRWRDGRACSDAAERIDGYIHSCWRQAMRPNSRRDRSLRWMWITPGRQVLWEVRWRARMCARR